VLGLDLTKSAVLSVLPWVTMAVAANVGGWLADTAISRGASVTTVRKVGLACSLITFHHTGNHAWCV
jgi:ACS family sodium-dependent inorganic phosphate cotransporter